jgi:hypothetical protein
MGLLIDEVLGLETPERRVVSRYPNDDDELIFAEGESECREFSVFDALTPGSSTALTIGSISIASTRGNE